MLKLCPQRLHIAMVMSKIKCCGKCPQPLVISALHHQCDYTVTRDPRERFDELWNRRFWRTFQQ